MSEEGFDEFEASLRDKFGTTEPSAEETTPTEAEAAPEADAAAAAPEAESSAQRARNELGQFVAEADLPEKYRGKTAAQIAEMHMNAESRLGELGNEVGELRRVREEWEAFQAEQNRPRVPSNWNELVADDPGEAAEQAFQARDDQAVAQALAVWGQYDPHAARAWLRGARAERQMEQMRASFQEQVQPVQQFTQQRTIEQSLEQVKGQYGEAFNQIAAPAVQMLQDDPELAKALVDPERSTWAITTAFRLAAAEQGANLSQAAQQAHQQDADAARAAKQAAAVISASSTPASREDKGAVDRFKQAIFEADTGLTDRFAES